MSIAAKIIGFGIIAALVGACSGSDSGSAGASVASLCAQLCKTAATLNCPNEPPDCVDTCTSTETAVPACKPKFRAFLECAAPRPASDLECDADGEANGKAGVCSAEQEALMDCILGGLVPSDAGAD